MTNANDFAYSIQYERRFGSEDQFSTNVTEGLTKLEYFAAMAMQGLLSHSELFLPANATIEQMSVEYAKALIAELNK